MKAAVIYWSATGNTEAMAKAVAEGAGAELFTVSEFTGSVEEDEFEPFFTDAETRLAGKRVAIFGSYGWGDGEWMRNWEERVKAQGIALVGDAGLMLNEMPDDDGLEQCRALGKALVG